MNDCIKKELLGKVDINELITQYKSLKKVDLSHDDESLINIMPFTNVCTNTNCQQQNLNVEFSRTGYVAHLVSIKPCSIFTGICKRIYGPSSILDTHTNHRIITIQSIENIDYIYFSGDLVYSRELLTMFSNNLIQHSAYLQATDKSQRVLFLLHTYIHIFVFFLSDTR
jgi:hypothetical protein